VGCEAKDAMRYNGTDERAEGKSMDRQMNRSRSNPSRAAVDGEGAKSLTNAARTFWLCSWRLNYDGIAKQAPDNFIDAFDRSRFWLQIHGHLPCPA